MASQSMKRHAGPMQHLRFWATLLVVAAPVWATFLLALLLRDMAPAPKTGLLIIVAVVCTWNSIRVATKPPRGR